MLCENINILYRLSEAFVLKFLQDNCSAVNEISPKAGHLHIQRRVTASEI
jgi:hypothetical protein